MGIWPARRASRAWGTLPVRSIAWKGSVCLQLRRSASPRWANRFRPFTESVSAVSGDPLTARVRLTFDQDVGPVVAHLKFYTHHDGVLVTECAAGHGDRALWPRVGDSNVEFVIPDLLLRPGVYTLGVAVRSAESGVGG